MGRELRTTLDIRKTKEKLTENSGYRERMIADYNKRGRKERTFVVGQQVYIRNYQRGDKWIPGIVTQVLGGRMYEIHFGSGSRKAHADQMKGRPVPDPELLRLVQKRGPEAEQEQELPQRRSERSRKLTDRMRNYVENRERLSKNKYRVNLIRGISRVYDNEEDADIKGEGTVRSALMWTYTPTPGQPAVPAPPPPPPPVVASTPASGGSPIVIQLPPVVAAVSEVNFGVELQGSGKGNIQQPVQPHAGSAETSRGERPDGFRGRGLYRGRGSRRGRRGRRPTLRQELENMRILCAQLTAQIQEIGSSRRSGNDVEQ
ncbi:hypothetical protein OSTOST_23029 [Ostertagia ostertagi]